MLAEAARNDHLSAAPQDVAGADLQRKTVPQFCLKDDLIARGLIEAERFDESFVGGLFHCFSEPDDTSSLLYNISAFPFAEPEPDRFWHGFDELDRDGLFLATLLKDTALEKSAKIDLAKRVVENFRTYRNFWGWFVQPDLIRPTYAQGGTSHGRSPDEVGSGWRSEVQS